jgi:hypothetical protein
VSDNKYMSVGEARELLGVSEPKIAQMIKDHEIPWEINPLDKRSKLLDRAFVEALAAKVQRPKDLPDAA